MSLADTIRERVSEHLGANLEYRRDGYRLSLNPIEDRFSEVGFIVWRETEAGLDPVLAGRTAADGLVPDDRVGSGSDQERLEATVRSLLDGELVEVEGRAKDTAAIPQGTDPDFTTRMPHYETERS